eukprot:Hpha_TRINITY_DN15686_c2_g7::TRINITY_DN15686_c2_g7_i2::g.100405::m.100405
MLNKTMSQGDVVESLTMLLEDISEYNDQTINSISRKTAFDSKDPPDITIRDYFKRLEKYMRCSTESFICSILLIDRILLLPALRKCPIRLNSFNVHRLLLLSLAVTAKLRDDTYYNNKYYAQVGGVPLKELNDLESYFLTLLYRMLRSWTKLW